MVLLLEEIVHESKRNAQFTGTKTAKLEKYVKGRWVYTYCGKAGAVGCVISEVIQENSTSTHVLLHRLSAGPLQLSYKVKLWNGSLIPIVKTTAFCIQQCSLVEGKGYFGRAYVSDVEGIMDI
jgi:hypothetical protein